MKQQQKKKKKKQRIDTLTEEFSTIKETNELIIKEIIDKLEKKIGEYEEKEVKARERKNSTRER